MNPADARRINIATHASWRLVVATSALAADGPSVRWAASAGQPQ